MNRIVRIGKPPASGLKMSQIRDHSCGWLDHEVVNSLHGGVVAGDREAETAPVFGKRLLNIWLLTKPDGILAGHRAQYRG